jgi:nucleolar protein 56
MTKSDIGKLRQINLKLTKKKIKESINEDNLICQAVNSIAETDKVINILSKRLREWYALYNPEFRVSNNNKFTELILKKSREDLRKELNVTESMGADLSKTDIEAIFNLAKKLISLFEYQNETGKYLTAIMERYCPNLTSIAGTTIGAKLIEHTGCLKRLAFLPSSTVLMIGAEKALFRHIKTGAKPPKHGLIHEHQFIQSAKRSEQGKKARALADKISMAVRIDFFKGKFIGAKMKQDLEAKFR